MTYPIMNTTSARVVANLDANLDANVGATVAANIVALLYPGDRAMRDRADRAESRFTALFQALAAAGLNAEPAVYHDDFADEVAAQLQRAAVVLVWCNPIEGGRRRDRLDAVLRQVARSGVFVSTHPDTIARLGTKDVLVDTRDLPFGSDVHRIDGLDQLAAELPARLQAGARVLKQHRGHSGIGVWRVEWAGGSPGAELLNVRHAQRGSEPELIDMPALLRRMAPYFDPAQGGHMIDQAWQPRLAEGMLRAYLVEDRVTGFGHQAINALHPTQQQPGPRLYHGPDHAEFQGLKRLLEGGWITLLRQRLGLGHEQLPLLWDADFMLGEMATSAAPGAAPGAAPRYVLCEINVSSVSPFPPSSIEPLVAAIKARLAAAHR